VLSNNVATFVAKGVASGQLKVLNLEDVTVGIWVDDVRRTIINRIDLNNDRGCSLTVSCRPTRLVWG
jgi:hypothetical protein